jgi:transposase
MAGGQAHRTGWAPWPGSAAQAAREAGRRPGLLVSQCPTAAAPSWHQVGDPDQVGPAPPARFDRAAYRGRNQVERSVGRLKQFRRVATRYDKRAVNYLAWVTLTTALIWL